MTDTGTPWEPPRAGSETAHLLGALDRLRTTFRWKVDGLDSAGLAVRIGASTLTLGGLLKTLALSEDYYSTTKLGGGPIGEPWESLPGFDPERDWEFESAPHDAPETLCGLWDHAVRRSRERVTHALADGGLDRVVHANDGQGH